MLSEGIEDEREKTEKRMSERRRRTVEAIDDEMDLCVVLAECSAWRGKVIVMVFGGERVETWQRRVR